MTLELGVWRIPAITLGIALGTESVGIAIIVELLGNIPGTDLTDSLITVVPSTINAAAPLPITLSANEA